MNLYSFKRKIGELWFAGTIPAESFEVAQRIAPGEVDGKIISDNYYTCKACGHTQVDEVVAEVKKAEVWPDVI